MDTYIRQQNKASKAGAKGLVGELGLRPDQQSGAYSKHFDKVLGHSPNDEDFYSVCIGRRVRHDSSRRFQSMATYPPHEVLEAEFSESSVMSDAFVRASREGLCLRYIGSTLSCKQPLQTNQYTQSAFT